MKKSRLTEEQNHRDPARVGRRRQGRGARAPARRNGSDALSLEAQVRRAPGERGEAAARPRGRESPAQAARRRPSVESPSRERLVGKKVVTPEQRRTAVTYAMVTAEVSERRA